MLDKSKATPRQSEPVVIKKYANRRLYNTESSTYVTLDDLGQMVRSDRDFVVYDAKSGEDLTHSVLTQIIVDQEARSTSPNLLPTPFLRQLIRFYDDMGISKMVPGYLQMSLEALAREQERLRAQFTSTWGSATLDAYSDQVRKNMELFEQAMRMWAPPTGLKPDAASEPTAPATSEAPPESAAGNATANTSHAQPTPDATGGARRDTKELAELRGQLADMQRKIEELAKKR